MGQQKEIHKIETEGLHLNESDLTKIIGSYQNRWSLGVLALVDFAPTKLADGFCQSCCFVFHEGDYFDLV
jgi:hypothetical protein